MSVPFFVNVTACPTYEAWVRHREAHRLGKSQEDCGCTIGDPFCDEGRRLFEEVHSEREFLAKLVDGTTDSP